MHFADHVHLVHLQEAAALEPPAEAPRAPAAPAASLAASRKLPAAEAPPAITDANVGKLLRAKVLLDPASSQPAAGMDGLAAAQTATGVTAGTAQLLTAEQEAIVVKALQLVMAQEGYSRGLVVDGVTSRWVFCDVMPCNEPLAQSSAQWSAL